MKKTRFIVFLTAFIFLAAIKVSASEIDKKITSAIDNELEDFINSLPQNVASFFPTELLNGDFSALANGEIDEKSFLDLISTYLLSGINIIVKNFASILSLIIIISIFNTLSSSLDGSNTSNILSLCSSLCISITVFNICGGLVLNVSQYMELLCNIMGAFVPLMLVLLTMGGNISTAIVTNGSMLLFINIIEKFILVFMLPLTKMCLTFGCAKSLNSDIDLGGISKTVKTAFTSVTVFTMSIFMFVLSYKSTLTQSVDSLSIKTARFAISSFVPLVGSSVNDALRTVTSSLSLIKSSCGIVAIIAIVVLMLPIIINLFLNKLSFSILSSMSKSIGGNKEGAILEEADSICGFLLTLVCCTCVLFIFALTIFLKSGATSG